MGTLRKKIIKVPPRYIDVLAASFQVSQASVYNALAYKTNNSKSQQIRTEALSRYEGVQETKTIFVCDEPAAPPAMQ